MMTLFKRYQKREKQKSVLPLIENVASSTGFYQATEDWLYDMYQSQTVWLKIALCFIGLLILLLFLSLLTNVLLFPLKKTVPYLYAFDKATGEITQLGELKPTQFSENWFMTRFLLIRYVINRESYDRDNLERPYQIAWAMSNNNIRNQYDAEVRTNQPTSPFQKYGKDKFITVHVLAVNPLNKDTASIRFEKILHDRATGSTQTLEKEAIVKWQYTRPITTQKMLDRDPLGFQVTYYQASQINVDNAQEVPP